MRNATAASGSAPVYFDPAEFDNLYGQEELVIDGGIICNNPALYAYMTAKFLNKVTKKMRILSIGTGGSA